MSNYVARNLMQGESIVFKARKHWAIFVNPAVILSLWIGPLIEFFTQEFVITNKRVVIKTGLIAINTLEMNIQKIETILVDQSILGRMLNFGTITIVGTGGTRESFDMIHSPIAFRKQFQRLEDGLV